MIQHLTKRKLHLTTPIKYNPIIDSNSFQLAKAPYGSSEINCSTLGSPITPIICNINFLLLVHGQEQKNCRLACNSSKHKICTHEYTSYSHQSYEDPNKKSMPM